MVSEVSVYFALEIWNAGRLFEGLAVWVPLKFAAPEVTPGRNLKGDTSRNKWFEVWFNLASISLF